MCRHRARSRSVAVHAVRHGQLCTNRNWALCLQVQESLAFHLKVVNDNVDSRQFSNACGAPKKSRRLIYEETCGLSLRRRKQLVDGEGEDVIEMEGGRSRELGGKQLLWMTKEHPPPGFGQCAASLPLAHQSACRE